MHRVSHLFLCNCENTIKGDLEALAKHADAGTITRHTNLCRRETAAFESAVSEGGSVCVACTQESALFSEIAEESGLEQLQFVNLRENAGWTKDRGNTVPKMAALLAGSTHETVSRLRTIESDGLCIVFGAGQQAVDMAALLNRTLSVTLLLSGGHDEVVLPDPLDFPVFSGRIASVSGSFGKFDLVVDGYAPLLPQSRGALEFAMARDGAKTRCSVIFDMSGKTPLFARDSGRDGYFRADPRDPAAVMRKAFDASGYVGTFEKPIYVRYDESICAHERSKKTGCTKCIDNCPASAIQPDGDHVAIDHDICGGCGNCAAHCPTGAVVYEYPSPAGLITRINAMAEAYTRAGGKNAILLFHDGEHGRPLIAAMARHGRGLPAHVIPVELHAATAVGHEVLTSALAAGISGAVIIVDPRKSDETHALREEIALVDALTGGLGHGENRITLVEEADPDVVEEMLWSLKPGKPIAQSAFVPLGGKREISRSAISALVSATRKAPAIIPLPASAPYGALEIDKEACTLCMACVSACPADALRDNPDRPQLRFVESACVQCGICSATCPEKAITLEARYNTTPAAMQPETLNEDEPAECTRCSKPFVGRKMLDRVTAHLGGKHWMFQGEERQALLGMCDSCRLEVLSEGGRDPFAIAEKPRTRTTEDYLEERKKGLTSDDFLS